MSGRGVFLLTALVFAVLVAHGQCEEAEEVEAATVEYGRLGRKLNLFGKRTSLLGTAIGAFGNGKQLVSRSFLSGPPALGRSSGFIGATPVSNFGVGGATSVTDAATGISFIGDQPSGRFFPIDPQTGIIVNPLPAIQTDTVTNQAFITIPSTGAVVVVDPITGGPVSSNLNGLSTTGNSPFNIRLSSPVGGVNLRLPSLFDNNFNVQFGSGFIGVRTPGSGSQFVVGK